MPPNDVTVVETPVTTTSTITQAPSLCTVSTPNAFDFRHPAEWKKWIARFNRYRNISGLSLRDQDSQVDALLYTMGSGAEDLLAKLQMTPAELSSYSTVEKKLTEHFVPKNNVIYERFVFNRRIQQPGESVDTFITDLFKLAETCEFAQL